MKALSRFTLASAAALTAAGLYAQTYVMTSTITEETFFGKVDVMVEWTFEDTTVDGRTGVKLVKIDWELEDVQIPPYIIANHQKLPVIELGDHLFAGWSLFTYTVPNHILKVGDAVFANCSSLTSISLGNGVRQLGRAPFAGTAITALTLPGTLTSLNGNPFAGCQFLNAVSVAGGNVTYSAVDQMLFDITQTNLLACAPGAMTVSVPSTTTVIADDAFVGCSKLLAIQMLCEVPEADKKIFADTPSTLVLSADAWSLTSWQRYVDAAWKGRTVVNTGTGDTETPVPVADENGIVWDVSVTQGKATLDVLVSDVSGTVSIPSSITLSGSTIPVTALSADLFENCTSITKVAIPASLTDVPASAFVGCTALEEFNVNLGNETYRAYYGALYSRDGKTLVKVPACFRFQTTITGASTITQSQVIRVVQHYDSNLKLIPEQVIQDGSDTITHSSTTYGFVPAVSSADLLNGVSRICDYAFTDCGTLPAGSSVKGTLTTTTDGKVVSTVKGGFTMPVGTDSTNMVISTSKVTGSNFYNSKLANFETRTSTETTYTSSVSAPTIPSTVACSKMAWFGSVWYSQVAADKIPYLGADATQADVASALATAADAQLRQHVTTAAEYETFRNWSVTVRTGSGILAGQQATLNSPYAWQSFALDSPVLLTGTIKTADVKLAEISTPDDEGGIAFALAVNNVTIGKNATEKNLKRLFHVAGSTSPIPSSFLEQNIRLSFGQPQGGMAVGYAEPVAGATSSFFLKAWVD